MTATFNLWGFLLFKKKQSYFYETILETPHGVNLSYFNFLRENRKYLK